MRAAAIGVALAGLGIAGYLTVVHYAGGTPVCAVAHGCATVQQSDYATLAGVPVAVLGLLGYVAILASLAREGEGWRTAGACLSLAGLGFSGWLTYLEIGVLHAICIWCVASAICMALLAALTVARVLGRPCGHDVPMAPVGERLRDPVLWTDASQIVKTVVAAVIAWVIARDVLGVAQPFLAPWAALLTVHATVYRTLARGLQQVGSTVLGVLLAFAAGSALGVNAASLGVVLLVGMLAGATRRLRAESTTAAATALVVLLTGSSGEESMLLARLLDTMIGIGVGLAVNLLVWPPLRDRAAARRVDLIDDRLGELLTDMAARLGTGGEEDDADEWAERTRDIEHDVDLAWSTVRQARESGRLNPRRGAAERMRASEDFANLLTRLEQAVAETRSMAHTMGGSTGSLPHWDREFRETWIDLLARTGRAIAEADVDGITRVRADVEIAARTLSGDEEASLLHPEHGALLVNLRNIADAMGDVAGAQPVRSRAPDPRAMPRRWRMASREGGASSS